MDYDQCLDAWLQQLVQCSGRFAASSQMDPDLTWMVLLKYEGLRSEEA